MDSAYNRRSASPLLVLSCRGLQRSYRPNHLACTVTAVVARPDVVASGAAPEASGGVQLRGRIDVPDRAATLEDGRLLIRGWVLDDRVPTTRVTLEANGHRLGRARLGMSRPDVAADLKEVGSERAGFELAVGLQQLRLCGWPLHVDASVELSDGTIGVLPPAVIDVAPVVGHVDDTSGERAAASGLLRVRGWAVGIFSAVARVEVMLDDIPVVAAGLARPRRDVADILGDDGELLSGFETVIDNDRVAPFGPRARIATVVKLFDGSMTRLDGEVRDIPAARRSPSPQLRPIRPGARHGEGPVRVLWWARALDRGGSQLRMRDLIEQLNGEGFSSTVVASAEGPLHQDLDALSTPVHIAPDAPLGDLSAYERVVTDVTRWAEGKFDLTVGPTLTSFGAIEVADRLGIPSIWRIGEAETLRVVAWWLGGHLDPEVEARSWRAFSAASAVMFNSEAAWHRLQKAGARGRFGLVKAGVNLPELPGDGARDARARARNKFGLDSGRLVLCTGTIWPVKGQALLARAMAQVRSTHPELEVAMIGQSDPGYERAIGRYTRATGLAASVRTLPFRHHLDEWYWASDAMACISESEAMPAAALEAMAHGKPVLGAEVGDLPAVIEPGVDGWLCRFDDMASVVDALGQVADASEDELWEMGRSARQRVAASYDPATHRSRVVQLFTGIASGLLPGWLEVVE